MKNIFLFLLVFVSSNVIAASEELDILFDEQRSTLLSFIENMGEDLENLNFIVPEFTLTEDEAVVLLSWKDSEYKKNSINSCITYNLTLSYYLSSWHITRNTYYFWYPVSDCKNLSTKEAIHLETLIDNLTLKDILDSSSELIELSKNPEIQLGRFENNNSRCEMSQVGLSDTTDFGIVYRALFLPCNISVYFEIRDNSLNVLQAISPSLTY